MFDVKWFQYLEQTLYNMGLDSDAVSFDEIKQRLSTPKRLSADDFAFECAYVILAGGFSQKTAKKIHKIICEKLLTGTNQDDLLKIFNNKNKINSILKIWNNRKFLCDEYYLKKTLQDKLNFIKTLPHIGAITSNHLARNLGENVVKYDIWIQRLGVMFAHKTTLVELINNKQLNPEIQKCCDEMFDCLVQKTGLPRGYIDVVLWKACQNKLIVIDNESH